MSPGHLNGDITAVFDASVATASIYWVPDFMGLR